MIFVILSVLIIVLDQLTKWLVASNVEVLQSIPIISGVFNLTYVQNTGAAFGIFAGHQWFFLVFTIIVILFMCAYVYRKKITNKLFLTAISFIVGGAIGNLIDRIIFGYVRDFFDFILIKFAIFNVADIFVVCGAGLLILYLILDTRKKKS